MRGKYIALSHCWGGQVSLQLKSHTIDNFKKGILFSHFPKTFQDAITICRALGVDYLWIDSICIIQDSKEDWDIQGAKMDQVYSNCLLTIAADSAGNGRAGFIRNREREELRAKTRKLTCPGPKGKKVEVFVRPWRDFGTQGGFGRHYTSPNDEYLEPSQRLVDQGSYLLRRGWVLQETFLPRRILHFLPDEVAWRCATVSRCECQNRPHEKVVHDPLDLEKPREIDSDKLKEYWKEVVEQYTRRRFTFPSDRLVALAGIASRAHTAVPDVHYYAGLWSDTLPSTLLWTVERRVEYGRFWDFESHRIEPRIAPTWSWASVTGCTNFLFWMPAFGRGKWADSLPDLSILDIHCQPVGHNRYGSVNDARLTVEGYLCTVTMRLTGGSKWHFPFTMVAQKPDGSTSKANGLLYPDTGELIECLEANRETGVPITIVSVYERQLFLVLKPVQERQSIFERIGVCHCPMNDEVVLPDWGHSEQFTLV